MCMSRYIFLPSIPLRALSFSPQSPHSHSHSHPSTLLTKSLFQPNPFIQSTIMRWSLSVSSVASAALFVLPALAAITPEMTMDERYLVRRSLNKGMGTRYGLDCTEEDCWQNGACAFTDYTLPSSVDGSTCVSEELWDSSAHCGGCISVSYKGKTITVMV